MTEKTNTSASSKKLLILQAVRAIAALVLICLVCCVLLALCNDLLYVSEDEKFNRKLTKIYPGTFTVDSSYNQTPVKEFASDANYGEILKVYKSTSGDYILQSKGKGGYSDGTVTLYVAVSAKDETIVGWAIESNSGQTFIGNITEKNQKQWYVGTRVDGDLSLGNNKVGGTTMSSTAINNAIKMAAQYCTKALHMGVDLEGEAKDAVIALLTDTDAGYAQYELSNFSGILNGKYNNETVKAMLSDSNNTIDYYFRATGSLGEIQVFVYGTDADRKIVVLGADSSIICQSANVTGEEDFVSNITTKKVFATTIGKNIRYALIANIEQQGDKTVYTVVGLQVGTLPRNYVLTIEIQADGGAGKIIKAEIASGGDGFEDGPGAPSNSDASNLVSVLVGATTANFDEKYQAGKKAGATQSADLIAVAARAALADFDASLNA